MTTATLTLTEFLLARIAEDEAAAREAGARNMSWAPNGTWFLEGVEHDVVGDEEAFCHPHNVAHIARHDPARVLAECEAKRQIVEEAAETVQASDGTTVLRAAAIHAERWMRHLVLPYVDHPDFQPEWRV